MSAPDCSKCGTRTKPGGVAEMLDIKVGWYCPDCGFSFTLALSGYPLHDWVVIAAKNIGMTF